MTEDKPGISLTAIGQRELSDEARARLKAREAAENLIPRGPGPLKFKIVKLD